MKPRSLHLQHFGPYTDHVVDFEPFMAEGLFLIHGDTGSGKSLLLDAICFALFGRGLGIRKGEEELRNKTAPADKVSAVTLEFTLGARRYRVHRTMSHDRASRRGGGVTRQPAEALMECAEGDPGFETVTAPLKVTEAVERLLGIERAQFCRTIVLPQGEFRELLLASAEDREKLLEQIFGSELYKAIERSLHTMDKQAEVSALGPGERTASLLSSAGARDRDELVQMREEAEVALRSRREALVVLSLAHARSLAATEGQRARRARNAQRQRLGASRATLALRFEEVSALRAESEAALRADGCIAAMRALEEAEGAHAGALGARSSFVAELAAATEALGRDDLSAARRAALEAEREGLLKVCEREEALGRELARAFAEAHAREEARGAVERAREALRAASARCEAMESERGLRARERARRAAIAAEESGYALRNQELAQRLEAARTRERLARRRAELERGARDAERKAGAAEARAREARARRDSLVREGRAAMAARLASELSAGQRCPVCGSEEHPRVASGAEAVVERGALEAAEAASREADEDYTRACAKHAQGLGELSGAEAQGAEASAADVATEPEILRALAEAQRDLSAAQEARRELEAMDRRSSELDRAWESARSGREETERALAALRAREEALGGRGETVGPGATEAEVQRSIAEARQALGAVDQERERRESARARWSARRSAAEESVARAERAVELSGRALAGARDEASKMLILQGFTTREEMCSARRPENEWRAKRREVLEHDEALETVSMALSELGEAELEENLAELESRMEIARAEFEEAQQSVGGHRERSEALGRLLEKVDEGGAERRAREAALARVRKVADLANGRSEGRVRLSRYVLLDQFDRVTEAASLRLDVMSDGRFRLRRRESGVVGKEFELMVEDAYTGAAERSAATLSGGEMFLASLAMALGLSDVIQQHAGGLRMESLFVDEGFGSLDEESLDKAVMVLEQLQSSRRLVGVVSHVPELRKRIQAKLEVLRTDRGSVTRAGGRHRAR